MRLVDTHDRLWCGCDTKCSSTVEAFPIVLFWHHARRSYSRRVVDGAHKHVANVPHRPVAIAAEKESGDREREWRQRKRVETERERERERE